MTKEAVNHPDHYNDLPAKCHHCGGQIECIDVVEAMPFNLGNAVKYVWREAFKGKSIEDLKKARWYLDREIEKREAGDMLPAPSTVFKIEDTVIHMCGKTDSESLCGVPEGNFVTDSRKVNCDRCNAILDGVP